MPGGATRLATTAALAASVLAGMAVPGGEALARARQEAAERRPHPHRHGTAARSVVRPSPRDAVRPARNQRAPARHAAAGSRQGRPAPVAPALPAPAVPVTLPAITPQVFAALRQAAEGGRTSEALLFTLAWKESRFDPASRNPASSARGLMQFTRGTWLEVVRDHGAAFGLASQAGALVTDAASGEITVRDRNLLEAILSLRDDPNLSAALAVARMAREKPNLARSLRRPVTEADLFLVHFLGPLGARRFLGELARAPSHRAADAVGPDAVAANRNVFISREGHHYSLREVYSRIERELRAQRLVHAMVAERMKTLTQPVEVASAE